MVDVRAKKKDTCKVAPETMDQMVRVRVLGAVLTKAKKKAKAKK